MQIAGFFCTKKTNSRELVAHGLYGFSFQLNSKLKACTMPPTSYAALTSPEMKY